MKVVLRKEVKNAYVGFNRATKGMRKYQINDKNERKQISGSTVAPALNAAQLRSEEHTSELQSQ